MDSPSRAVAEPSVSVAELEESIRKEPVNAELYRQLGRKLHQGGKIREAERTLLRALEIEPRNVENHLSLADFYQAQGLKFKAFKHLNIVLQLEPRNQKAMDLLGVKKRKNALYDISA
jgi:cytochrome c-type biogenesis protein CcmH/NrfG